jgi:glucan phosphorylase
MLEECIHEPRIAYPCEDLRPGEAPYDLPRVRELCCFTTHTPLPPLEASGTSGRKAAFKGVPHVSVLDGWRIKGCTEDVTGRAVGDSGGGDAGALYQRLENEVLPLYYRDSLGWIAVMKGPSARMPLSSTVIE